MRIKPKENLLTLKQAAVIAIASRMSSEYRQEVITSVLTQRSQLPSGARRVLNEMLKTFTGRLRVPGFERDASKSPAPLLLQPVFRIAKNGSVLEAILYGWEELQGPLRQQMRAFLQEHGIPLRESVLSADIVGEWTNDQMHATAQEFVTAHPESTLDDALLMLCCQCAWLPLPPDKDAETQDDAEQTPCSAPALNTDILIRENIMLDSKAATHAVVRNETTSRTDAEELESSDRPWDSFLAMWQALPPEAPEWQGLEQFISVLRALAEAKQEERDAGMRTLQQALAALREDSTGKLGFFFIRAAEWTGTHCTPQEAVMLTQDVAALQKTLLEYTQTEQTPTLNLATSRDVRKSLSQLEERIEAFRDRLDTALRAPAVHDESTMLPSDSTSPPLPPELSVVDEQESFLAEETNATEAVQQEEDTLADPVLASEEPEDIIENSAQPLLPPPLVVVRPEPPDSSQSVLSFDATELLWNLVDQNDLSGAYWLSQALTEAGQDSPLPAPTLAASQAGCWLDFTTPILLADSCETAPDYVPQQDEAHILMGLAAALLPALLSSGSNFVGWLNTSVSGQALREVVGAVHEFSRYNRALRLEDLAGMEAPAKREATLRELSHRTGAWLQNARLTHPSIRRARDIWERLLRRELNDLLAPVIADRRNEAEKIRQYLPQFNRREAVQRLLTSLGRELHHRKEMDLVGDVREGMIRDILEVTTLVENWCTLTGHHNQAQEDWFAEHVVRLCTRLQRWVPEAQKELVHLVSTSNYAIAAASHCLQRALTHLMQTLRLAPALQQTPSEPNSMPPVTWWLHDEQEREKSLVEALCRRLLWLPEITLRRSETTEQFLPPDPDLLQRLLPERPPTTAHLQVALEGWLAQRDFRFVELIRRALPDSSTLKEHCDEERNRARTELAAVRERTALAVERALVDGILAEEEYAGYRAEIEAVRPESVVHFAPEFDRLLKVELQIEQAQRSRIATQQALWEDLRPVLATHTPTLQRENLSAFIANAFAKGDARLIDEALAHLREAHDTGRELDTGWLDKQDDPVLEAFREAEARINEALIENDGHLRPVLEAIRRRKSWAGLSFGEVSPERLTEASTALEQWRYLKQKRPNTLETEDINAIANVLNYLGFAPLRNGQGRLIRKNEGSDWVHLSAQLTTAGQARPIPDYGVLVEHYDIVCLWSRLGAEAISARLETMGLNSGGVIVFYMDRLKFQQRQRLGQLARSKGFAFAVLDETLHVFLAVQRDARLRAFLRCALPFSAPMPYTPDCAGAVPPEMFFGREEMARSLQDTEGSCLVYGGRQLGKSALLMHAKRQFDRPEEEQYAWIDSISGIGDAPQAHLPSETLYRRLYEKFIERGLISGPQASTPQGMIRQIREAVNQTRTGHKPRRILVMLDEADNFLEADAKNNFRIVADLRDLMVQTDHRFKVVFAGLHHVQKFQGISNQPLAHFGAPILVGPLAFQEARRLVREPLEALGFRIEDTEVLRILSHTNYHPGLIQKYCHELLKRLYREGRRDIPTPISKEEVESIYLEPEVRRFISGRFELTLALDDRYRAIAYAIIVEQMAEHDSYALPYPDYRVLDLVRSYCPQLFTNIESDGMRILLDEMCGLGVLVEASGHSYRLRSPNLVRLMGTESNIEHRLEELAAKALPPTNDPESLHAPLDEQRRQYSPLTYAQESALNPRKSGVGIVFASQALGLDSMRDAARRCLPPDLVQDRSPRAHLEEIPARVTGEMEVRDWLRNQVEAHRTCERRLFFQEVQGAPPGLEKRIRAAIQFCQEILPGKKAPSGWTRVLFFLAPGATWLWLSLPTITREDMEGLLDACTWPRLWDISGIKQRLMQQEMPHTDDIYTAVLEATGGWPWLIEQFFARCHQQEPHTVALRMAEEIRAPASPLADKFRRYVGLQSHSLPEKFLYLIRDLQGAQGIETEELLAAAPALLEEESLNEVNSTICVEFLLRMGCITHQNSLLKVDSFLTRLLP